LESVKEEHELALEATKAARPKYDEARRQLRQAQEQHKELQEQHKVAQTKMSRLQDDQARRNDRIFRQQPKLHEVYKWIDSNRSMFRKRIYGPIVCEITTKSKNTAAYLEQHVPNATLKSFVVESKEDYDLLYHNVREKLKLPINIIVIDRFKEQKPRLYSDAKMAILKRDHGVVGYMDESFTAPDVIFEALKNKARVHQVLVGDEQTQESLNNKNLLGYLTQSEGGQDKLQSCCIFASEGNRSFKYQSNISKYNGKASTKIDEIKPAMWLAPGVSDDVKQKVHDELKEIEQQLDNVTPDLEAAKQKMVDLQEDNHAATDRVRKAHEELALISKLMSKINNAERKLQEAERHLDVDDDEERNRLIASLKNRISHSITALEAHAESHKCSMETTYKMAGVRMDYDKAAINVQRAE
jgi:chromosome segregation ATPase